MLRLVAGRVGQGIATLFVVSLLLYLGTATPAR